MKRALIPIAAALLLFGCDPAEQSGVATTVPDEPIYWPPAPSEPKIQFLYAFGRPGDLGIRSTLFSQLWTLIAGEEAQAMLRPSAIAVAGQRMAVADPGIGVVHLFDTASSSYARLTDADGQVFVSPVGVAFGPGRLFVADSMLRKVFVLDDDGDLVRVLTDMARPTGLAFEPNSGRLYVADTLRHEVAAYDPKGERLFAIGGRGPGDGTFNFPTHLSIAGNRLYVNDAMNFRLQTFDLDGRPLSTIGHHGDGSGDFAFPKGVAVDGEGHLYVVDALFNRVQIFDAQGRFLLEFGGPGGDLGEFWLPAGLFIAENRIYVADSYNKRIQVFQFLGSG